MTDRWKKNLILLKYDLVDLQELDRILRYKKGEEDQLYEDIASTISTEASDGSFVIVLVPHIYKPRLINFIVHNEIDLKECIGKIKCQKDYEEIWCHHDSVFGGVFYGRILFESSGKQFIEIVAGETARLLDKFPI